MAIFFGLLLAAQTGSRPVLHDRRESPTDLEITGMVPGVPPGQSRLVSRDFIATLPHVSAVVKHDENFQEMPKPSITVGGVSLDVLARSLGADPGALAVEAVCSDGYTADFPPGYTQTHHPIFGLTIDHLTPNEWAKKNHSFDVGPYFITYADFKPAFRVLSHSDRAQVPSEVTRLNFTTVEDLYAPITPKAIPPAQQATSPVYLGFRIAQQNCYRCHNAGGHGGSKAGRSWRKLGNIAKENPRYFIAYIHNPQAIDPTSDMPANPKYDQATLNALTRYFQTFAAEGN